MRPGATDPQARSEGREGGGGLYREGALCEWEPPTCAFCGGCGEHCLVDLCLLGAQARIEPGSHLWRGERLPVFELLLQSTSDRVAVHHRSVFLTVLEAGRPRSGCQHGQVLVKACFLVTNSHLLGVSSASFLQAPVHSPGRLPWRPECLLKAVSTFKLGVASSACELAGRRPKHSAHSREPCRSQLGW